MLWCLQAEIKFTRNVLLLCVTDVEKFIVSCMWYLRKTIRQRFDQRGTSASLWGRCCQSMCSFLLKHVLGWWSDTPYHIKWLIIASIAIKDVHGDPNWLQRRKFTATRDQHGAAKSVLQQILSYSRGQRKGKLMFTTVEAVQRNTMLKRQHAYFHYTVPSSWTLQHIQRFRKMHSWDRG